MLNKVDVLIDIIDLHPSKIAVYNDNGDFFYANTNYMLSYNIDLSNKKNLNFDSINFCTHKFEDIKLKLSNNGSFNIQKQKGERWFEYLFFYTKTNYIIHISSDITPTKEQEMKLGLISSFFENINEGIVITNHKGLIQSVNKGFSKITGYAENEALGKNPNILKSGIHDIAFYQSMWESIEKDGYWKGEIWDKRKNGEIYPQILSISKALNSKSKEDFYMSVFTDITNLKDIDKKVYYHANYDSLTNLPNRSYFNKQLENILKEAQNNNSTVALFFIDVDKFKEVNDSYGHNIGDKMLVAISKRLLNSVKKDDVIARIGGDEFVLIAKNIKNIENIEQLALKLQDKIQQPLEIDKYIFNVSLSIGISIYPQHGTSSNDLLKHADIAMYEVKKSTKNSFKIYDRLMSTKIDTKVSIQNEIRRALSKDEFIMHYQPVIDFHTGLIVGAEALVRWHHPTKEILEPNVFLEFVLSAEMEKEFNCLVLSKILKDLTLLNKTFSNNTLKISINISKEQLLNSAFCLDFIDVFKNHNIGPSQIELEIIEAEILDNADIIKENIEKLSSMGFGIAFDNFGTGYSSLSYLKNIKVDKLKIDRVFIKNMIEDKKDLNIVKSIVHVAQLFDLKVQVEGVETEEQYLKLKDIGCDFSQGFYHSNALGIDDFISYFSNI